MERNQDATKWFLYSTKKKNSTFQEWLYDHLTLGGSAHNRNSRGVENRNTLVSKPVTMRRGALDVDPQFAVGNLKSRPGRDETQRYPKGLWFPGRTSKIFQRL